MELKIVEFETAKKLKEVGFDLTNCTLQAVGSRGNAVFLFDKTSDTIYFFQVLKDHSIMEYANFDVKTYLK